MDRYPAVRFVDTNLEGAGQVMLQGNAATGLLFLVGICWGAAASTVVFMAVGNVFETWGAPALTFPFNLVM